MPEFNVRWEVDIEAETAFEAAFKAWQMHRDPNSTATVFEVAEKREHRSRLYETIDLQAAKVERDRHDH